MTPTARDVVMADLFVVRALAASKAANPHGTLSLDLEIELRHAMTLAARAPELQIDWVLPTDLASHAMATTHKAAGLAYLAQQRVLTPAVTTRDHLRILYHEIGHHRDPDWRRNSPMLKEVAAWRFAAREMLVWQADDSARVVEALRHNVDTLRVDALESRAADVLRDEIAARPYRTITSAQIHDYHADRYAEQYGPRACAARGCAERASRRRGRRHLCPYHDLKLAAAAPRTSAPGRCRSWAHAGTACPRPATTKNPQGDPVCPDCLAHEAKQRQRVVVARETATMFETRPSNRGLVATPPAAVAALRSGTPCAGRHCHAVATQVAADGRARCTRCHEDHGLDGQIAALQADRHRHAAAR